MTKSAKWLWGIFALLIIFFLVVFVTIFSLFSDSDTEDLNYGSGGTIAVVELKEPIVESESIVRQFKRYRENQTVKAVVFRIESPGGGVSASQEIYEEVKKTRESGKPVVVSMGSVAASGGYYVAIGASRIVANPGSVTGSIGVISQFVQYDDLMKKIGLSSSTIKSGKLKDAGSPFRKMTEDDKRYFQEMVDDIYGQFVGAVAQERKLDVKIVRTLADGRVFTGRKAYQLKLIDTLGTYEDAVAIAASMAGITGTPHLIKEKKKERLSDMILGSVREELKGISQEVFARPIVQYLYTQPQ
ncbi:MAG: signal peptide peptidase SppA [Bacteroidota bacterium]|jgi:protease-4